MGASAKLQMEHKTGWTVELANGGSEVHVAHPRAVSVQVDDGCLYVHGENKLLAVYAAGSWVSAVEA